MDLSLSLSRTRRHYFERVMERDRAERETKGKVRSWKKETTHAAKKIMSSWDYTFSSLCVPVGENVFAHILGRALR